MKRKTDDQSADHREQVETGSKPLSVDRRGFLHRSALVIGAFVVGLGRTESAFGTSTTYVVNCCNLCKPYSKSCPCTGGYILPWFCSLNGKQWRCIECYKTNAVEQSPLIEDKCKDATYCSEATCSTVKAVGGGQKDSMWERAWGHLDDLGIGCYDPDTGAYIIWSEPGTACDSRSPGNPGPPPEHG